MIWASRWRVRAATIPPSCGDFSQKRLASARPCSPAISGGVGIFEELPVLARPHAGNELRRGNQFVLVEDVDFLGRDAVRTELVGLAGIVGHRRFGDVRAAVARTGR